MRWICLPLAALVLAGCGYIGAPLPPTLDIPQKVTDLRLLQRTDKVVLDFTIPPLTTEGLPLKLSKVELLADEKPLPADGLEPGPVHLEYPAADWSGSEVSFRVRIFSRRGRDGGWSDAAALRVIPPLEVPSGLRADAVAEGVRLAWDAPQTPADVQFRIRRRTRQEDPSELATAGGRQWVDTSARYGVSYEYTLQAVLKPSAESAVSEPVTCTPVDRFPPAVPQALTALLGSSSIELTWDRNTEPDLRGYYLYRAAGGKPLERVGDLLEAPAYSDRDIQPGTRHRYAVSSVDQSGNESRQSQPVEVTPP